MWIGRKLPLTLAFGVLVALAFGAGCKGFFVKPTVTSVVITPATPTIPITNSGGTPTTQQFAAIANFSDGSPPAATSATWTESSSGAVATINASSGLATATGLGQTTITGTSTQNPSISSTTTLTVTVACITSIAVTPNPAPAVTHGNTQQFTATATTCNGQTDITNAAIWTSSNTAAATISSSGLATAIAAGSTNITAASGSVISPAVVLNVN
jgi:hypothetical protein